MSSSAASSRRRRRGLGLLSLTVIGALATSAVTTSAGAAAPAPPAGDCAQPFPVADVHADDPVTGLTVTHGTTPEPFSGTVLGVLHDGIAPGIDLVMVRLSSSLIDRVGVWEGMSGSPVYAADHRLIGAVSWGLSEGPTSVVGLTPYAAMQEWLPGSATGPVSAAVARTVARAAGIPRAAATRGFTALPTPLAVGGISPRSLGALARRAAGRAWVPSTVRSAVPLASAGAAPGDTGPDASSIVAGGNLAAGLTYGEVAMGALGTVTSVCDGRVVGMGHPVEYVGRTSLTLQPADAIYVQDDPFAAFKVANLGAPVGTLTQDRTVGVAGALGALPPSTDVTTTVTYRAHTHTGVSHVARRSPDNVATTTLLQVVGDHEAVVEGPARGTESATWTMAGTGPGGTPFSMTTGDLFAGKRDLSWPVGFAIGDLVYRLDRLPGVSVDAVTTTHRLTDGARLLTLQAVEVKQGRTWVALSPRRPLDVRAGHRLDARLVLATASGATRRVRAHLVVPASYAGRTTALEVGAGEAAASSTRPPQTLEGFTAWLQHRVRNDEVELTLQRGPGGGGDAGAMDRAGSAPAQVSTVVGPLDSVVHGSRYGFVRVR